jgi:hypothetical protein
MLKIFPLAPFSSPGLFQNENWNIIEITLINLEFVQLILNLFKYTWIYYINLELT